MSNSPEQSDAMRADERTKAAARSIARAVEFRDPETPVIILKPIISTATGHAIVNRDLIAPLWTLYVPHALAAREIFEQLADEAEGTAHES